MDCLQLKWPENIICPHMEKLFHTYRFSWNHIQTRIDENSVVGRNKVSNNQFPIRSISMWVLIKNQYTNKSIINSHRILIVHVYDGDNGHSILCCCSYTIVWLSPQADVVNDYNACDSSIEIAQIATLVLCHHNL